MIQEDDILIFNDFNLIGRLFLQPGETSNSATVDLFELLKNVLQVWKQATAVAKTKIKSCL